MLYPMQADPDPHAALKDVRAENARLRAALKPFAEDGFCPTCAGDGSCFEKVRDGCALKAAQDALGLQPGEA